MADRADSHIRATTHTTNVWIGALKRLNIQMSAFRNVWRLAPVPENVVQRAARPPDALYRMRGGGERG
jgi:hypothetical protein